MLFSKKKEKEKGKEKRKREKKRNRFAMMGHTNELAVNMIKKSLHIFIDPN